MAVYTIPTTAEISEASFSPPVGLATGDVIVTQGYYAVGDGGAAEFAVTEEQGDNYFSHPINGHTGWIADLVIHDGVVNVDQLGAKGDAVLPDSYDDPVTDVSSCNSRTQNTLAANAQAFNNVTIFNTVFGNTKVKEVRLSTGKIYAVRAGFSILSDHTLNGCGAAIMNLKTTESQTVHCEGTASAYVENIEICNLRLIGNYIINGDNIQGLFINFARNIQIHDVEIERYNFGIHSSINSASLPYGHANQVMIGRVHIHDVRMGVQFNAVHNGWIIDSTITADYTQYMGNANTDHCIYGTDGVQNCVFKNLVLQNQKRGNGIILKGGNGTSKDLLIENVRIDHCRKGIGFENPIQFVNVCKVCATYLLETGISFTGAQNILIENSSFTGDMDWVVPEGEDLASGFKISSGSYITACIQIQNCQFVFPHKFFIIGQDRISGCYDFQLINCHFKITEPLTDLKKVPAYIKGIISDIIFYQCRFETNGFLTESHNHNGVFFYFDSILAKPDQEGVAPVYNEMHWFFDRCSFVNGGSVTVNSAILSKSYNDDAETVFCSVRNSVFDGFRWTIRVATTVDTQNRVGDVYWQGHFVRQEINPCYSGSDPSLRSSAVTLLNAKKRFVVHNSYYSLQGNGTLSIPVSKAEEIGV